MREDILTTELQKVSNESQRRELYSMDWLDDKDKIIEGAFAECYLKMHPMICIHGILFTIDGIVSDESGIKNDIYSMVRPYVTSGLARKVEQLLQTIKLEAYSEPLPLQTDRIHVANGTLFLNGEFSAQKDFCLNRLPVIYNSDAEKPVRWLKFMEELLNPDDILTLQEYMGYMLLPTTKAQKMMLIIGKGGEGKSRIGLVLRELFGNNMYSCSLQKIEVDKFARANLEYMLITVDDDMKLEALPQTNHIKSIVTLEDQIDLERKGQQSFQGVVYARLIAFGNGGLHALYDKTDGFYRRQLILTTKDKVDGREDDPYLIDKLRKERDGIFIWALEGLQRLISNNYVFTESVDAKQNLVDAQEEGNNILAFMKSDGYLQFEIGKKISSTDFYNIYVSWCEDNLEKPRASAGFLHYIKENQKRYGLIYDAKCIGNCRGFHNVCKSEFSSVIGKTPFD